MPSSGPNLGGPALAWAPPSRPESRMSRSRELAMDALTRSPPVWDAINRSSGKLLGTYGGRLPGVCSWIEPQLHAWLAGRPAETPVFAFVNLLEAHEPYLANGGEPLPFGDWLDYARRAQHTVRWIRGDWTPTPQEVDGIRASYLGALRGLDRRIAGILRTFAQHRPWDRTVFVLTSDDGQAFLEPDTLYHRFRVDEPLTRIPLWVRVPGGRPRPATVPEWVSLIDVPRTLATLVGRDTFGDPQAGSLLEADGPSADRTVYAMTDGTAPKEVPGVPEGRLEFLNRLEVAVYEGDRKAVAGESGADRAYQVGSPLPDPCPPVAPADAATAGATRSARSAVELALARIASKPYHGSVERRIAGWEY